MATIPISFLPEGNQQVKSVISDIDRGITGLIGPLNVVTARIGILKGGLIAVGVAAGGAVVLGVAKLIKATASLNREMIKLAATAEEIENRFKVVFGSVTPRVAEELNNFAVATGRSRVTLEDGAARMQTFARAMGLTEEGAAEVSLTLTKLAVDLDSFNDLTGGTEEALRRLRQVLTGSAEAGDRLSVNTREQIILQTALRTGLIESRKEMTEVVKFWARYITILEQSELQQNDAIRTADSLRNVQKRIRSEFENTAATVGEDVANAFRTFIVEGVGVTTVMATIRTSLVLAGLAGVTFFEVITSGFNSLKNFVELLPNVTEEIGLLKTAFEVVDKTANQITLDVLKAQIRFLLKDDTYADQLFEGIRRKGLGRFEGEALIAFQTDELKAYLESLKLIELETVNTVKVVQDAKDDIARRGTTTTGDPLREAARFARELLASRPALVVGLRSAFDGLSTAIGDAIAGVRSFGEAFTDVFQRVLSDVTAVIARVLLLRTVIRPILRPLVTGTDSFFGEVLSQLGFAAAAKGMVQPFARGGFPTGQISSPVLFGLAGEKGREFGFQGRRGRAVAPLVQDPTSGAYGVRMMGGGDSSTSVTFYNDFGSTPTPDQTRRSARHVEMQFMRMARAGGGF